MTMMMFKLKKISCWSIFLLIIFFFGIISAAKLKFDKKSSLDDDELNKPSIDDDDNNTINQKFYSSNSYPPDFMPDHIRKNGGIFVHFFLLIYICLSLGIVCDYYFLSSLGAISDELNLPADVAGATFMAIGTSAPELFTSIIGVFISKDDIGTGTILGSAVFNIIFIPAVCSFASYFFSTNQQANVSKFAIIRDSIFYLITVTTLLLVLKDNFVDWIESLAMICLFCIYLIIMYYNTKLGDLAGGKISPTITPVTEKTPLLTVPNEMDGNGMESLSIPSRSRTNSLSNRRLSSMAEDGIIEEENWAESNLLMKILLYPVQFIFRWTIPKPIGYWFITTFIISIFWIILLTYLSVWMVTIIGDTLKIPETVGGLTLLAAGTSIPELISSVLVVKRAGLVDMALCNSIGSNIFDILICLGLPWFIKSIINMIDFSTLDTSITSIVIHSEGLPLTTFSLLLAIIALITSLSMFEWKLSLGVGITCTCIYIVFITIASFVEIAFA
uniref:Probable sodium/potassium/calcium exchanger CG1090 n=1 Tax=Dermatophagoides pteronyssinus TaxID=6956 RepID=A0A6P6Y5V0_DERPT|nr:probable sodium/potassium/calcium exchanger CG1090 [Dermatophagoides pteronyssinus]